MSHKSWFGRIWRVIKRIIKSPGFKNLIFVLAGLGVLGIAGIVIAFSTISLPTLNSFSERKVSQSTKIYDRTGDILLYDVHQEIRRTVVDFDEISDNIKHATIAIEDDSFYSHFGVRPIAFVRAVIANLTTGSFSQGGSTITQQVVKNTLLTPEKTISRKVKEWVLAVLLEQRLTKDEILNIYLNESPYGGPIYGVQEAATRFFGKDADEVSLAEAAYLAALPQAPTYYSPYGNHKDQLEKRKNMVLSRMLDQGYISKEEFETAKAEVVEFQKQDTYGIKAPHFVFYIKEILEEKYGQDAVETDGLKVITTIDYELQKKAEEIVEKHARDNSVKFNAENASLVAIDPQTGQILSMVGSRNYFDEEIEGAYNIATANRQPGSAFKPFVYAAAFNKGYRPETIVYDAPTEFSATCSSGGNCYSPQNYDELFVGPISLRNALAQSRNVPAVKALYLAGLKESLRLAEAMGITTLGESDRYGLTLVLGGGEVSPLDLTSSYGPFATDGIKHPTVGILKVEDAKGNVLEEYEEDPKRVLSEQVARQITSILSDPVARAPLYGAGGNTDFGARDVAFKTGTTNDYRDVWVVGYTPNMVVGAWAGNNDNRSMEKKISGMIIVPLWREFMDFVLPKVPSVMFNDPEPQSTEGVPPIVAGFVDNENPHNILHFINKDRPLDGAPSNPGNDPQYWLWESGVQSWLGNGSSSPENNRNEFSINIINPESRQTYSKNGRLLVAITVNNGNISEADVYVNNRKVGSIDTNTNSFEIIPGSISSIKNNNQLRVVAKSTSGETAEETVSFKID